MPKSTKLKSTKKRVKVKDIAQKKLGAKKMKQVKGGAQFVKTPLDSVDKSNLSTNTIGLNQAILIGNKT